MLGQPFCGSTEDGLFVLSDAPSHVAFYRALVVEGGKYSSATLALAFSRTLSSKGGMDSAQHWYVALDNAVKTDYPSLEARFLADWEIQVQSLERRVRTLLKQPDWHQKRDEPVRAYNLRFKRIMGRSASMALVDRLDWYLTGILPHLRVHCSTDARGQPWECLDALMEYALGQELKSLSVRQERIRKASCAPVLPSVPKPQAALARKATNAQNRKRRRDELLSAAKAAKAKRDDQAPRSKAWLDACRKGGKCLRCGKPGHRVADCTMPASAPQPSALPDQQ